jgi:arylsulfatase A-like enzyme
MGLTPNLDAMARRGAFFEHAFTCQPVCGPARAALQTGMHAASLGCWKNNKPLPPDVPTLAKLFDAAGYDTGYIGKWHLAAKDRKPVPRELRGGYKFWRASDALEYTSYPYDGCVFDEEGESVRLRGYRVDALTDIAIDYVQQDRQRPFFLFVSHLEPHFQTTLMHFIAPDGYADRYRDCYVPPDLAASEGGDWREELPDYYGMCASLDENLGRLLDALKQRGLYDNTIVMFTSDHGCHFRTRNKEYKRSCHESSIRIPLVIDGPAFRGTGTRRELVSLVDLPPTLLSGCGLKAPAHMHGRDLMPLVGGKASDWRNEVLVQITEHQISRCIRTERWTYSAMAPRKDGVLSPVNDLYVDDCLYDLQADPCEQNNLAGRSEFREVIVQMRQRLIEAMVAAGEARPVITADLPA